MVAVGIPFTAPTGAPPDAAELFITEAGFHPPSLSPAPGPRPMLCAAAPMLNILGAGFAMPFTGRGASWLAMSELYCAADMAAVDV